MITLRYRSTDMGEQNTFTASQEGHFVRFVARVRRTDAVSELRLAFDGYVGGRTVPHQDVAHALLRSGAESWQVQRVRLGEGMNPEPVNLVGVPESVGDAWGTAAEF